MIKQIVKLFIVAVVMLMPFVAFALPGAHDPYTGGQGYTCPSCHTIGNSIANNAAKYGNNVCLRCHNTGNTATTKHFLPTDFSNIYNNAGVAAVGNPDQTSHKWFGSDNVAAAGAVPPIDPRGINGLNKPGFTNALSCARCHSVHGSSGIESGTAPFLRMPNDSDQLCRSCHRLRDTTDHTKGTHPVNVSYTSARNANILAAVTIKTTFRTAPVTNAVNPTGEVKLLKGDVVVCSTCHGVHYSDSNSATYDSYSAPGTFGPLSSSKGYLLRVSAFGATPDDVNICTNCHVSKNHNVKVSKVKPSVQCNDCHSGHVEYDAAAPAELKNVNLVRRYLQYTTAGRVSKRILYRSDTAKEFWNSTKTGVCQVCHTPPQDHYATPAQYPNGTFTPTGTYTSCTDCHNHAEPTGAFSYGTGGSCSNACHGLPPTTAVAPGPTGPVVGYTNYNEANSPHAAHAAGGGANVNDFDCNECHNGYGMPNIPTTNPNSIEVFKTPKALPGLTASYTGGNCYNVYCHSTGRGTWKPAMNPISWGSTKGVIIGQGTECQSCHDDPNSSVAHLRHVSVGSGMGYGCVTCHASTVSNNTTLLESAKVVNGNHTNGVKNVAYSGVGAAVGSTCADIKCHSNGKGAAPNITPSWTSPSSGACGACHWTDLTSPVLATGSHTAHFDFMSGTQQEICAKCHVAYTSEINSTHANGTINTGGTGCAVCHASPYSTASVTPAWGTNSTGCGQCHSAVGAFTGTGLGPNTGSHNKHMAIPALCNQCHTGAIAGISGGTSHATGNVDVTSVGYPPVVAKHTAGSGYRSCSSAGASGCHVSPYTTSAVVTPTWGVAAGCASCHTGAGAFTGSGLSPTTGGHTKHIAIPTATCASCHAGATAGISGGSFHIDGNIDATVVGYALNVTKHTYGSGYKTCSTAGAAGCHASPYNTSAVVTPTWGFAAGCVSCHTTSGAFTGTGSSPVTGSHSKHMAAAVGAACVNCHAGATAGTSGGNFHIDGNIDVVGGYTANVTKHTAGTYTGTCNTTCHATSSPSPSPVWGVNSGNDYCTRCHGTGTGSITSANRNFVAPSLPAGTGTGNVSANVKTGAHQTHLLYLNGFSNYSTIDYRCEACHGTLPASNTYVHANGVSSPQATFQKLATNRGAMTPTYTGTTCANTYCHNPAGPGGKLTTGIGTNVAPTWTNAAYIVDGTKKTSVNCNKCHRVPGDASYVGFDHGSVTIADVCSGCHGHEGDTQGDLGARHMDGIKMGGGSGCNGCHGYPPMTSAQLVGIGPNNYENGGLQKYAQGGGHHTSHLLATVVIGDGFGPCLPCHPQTSHHNINPSIVERQNVDVNVAGDMTYRFDGSRSKRYNTSSLKCSNVSCHFQPTPVW